MSRIYVPPKKNVYISEYYPSTNYSRAPSLDVGQFTGPGDDKRTLLEFDVSSLTGTIDSAYLYLYLYRNEVPSISKPHTIYRLESSFKEDEVTYAEPPSYSSTQDATVTITDEINTFIKWDITQLVKGWLENKIINYGIILIGLEDSNGLVAYRSTRYSDPSYWPYLEINFCGDYLLQYPVEEVITTDDGEGSIPISLGPKIGTFAIKNTGILNSADIFIQLSPDKVTWINYIPNAYTIPCLYPNDSMVLSTSAYLNYARVAYKSHILGRSTTLEIHASTKGS